MSMVRLILTDAVWEELAEVLQSVKRPDGRPAVLSDRMFIEAVLYTCDPQILGIAFTQSSMQGHMLQATTDRTP